MTSAEQDDAILKTRIRKLETDKLELTAQLEVMNERMELLEQRNQELKDALTELKESKHVPEKGITLDEPEEVVNYIDGMRDYGGRE